VYDDSQTIDIDNVPLHGGILLKTLVLSIDPYLRGLMVPSGHSYAVRRLPCPAWSFSHYQRYDRLDFLSESRAFDIIPAPYWSYALIGFDPLSINSFGVGVVLRSECPQVKAGDHLYGRIRMNSF